MSFLLLFSRPQKKNSFQIITMNYELPSSFSLISEVEESLAEHSCNHKCHCVESLRPWSFSLWCSDAHASLETCDTVQPHSHSCIGLCCITIGHTSVPNARHQELFLQHEQHAHEAIVRAHKQVLLITRVTVQTGPGDRRWPVCSRPWLNSKLGQHGPLPHYWPHLLGQAGQGMTAAPWRPHSSREAS